MTGTPPALTVGFFDGELLGAFEGEDVGFYQDYKVAHEHGQDKSQFTASIGLHIRLTSVGGRVRDLLGAFEGEDVGFYGIT